MAKKNFLDSIDKTNISSKKGISSLFTGPEVKEEINTVFTEKYPEEIRQTFIIKSDHLEKIRDYVHLKRQQGDSMFTQKDALQEAFELLFKKIGKIPSRPEHIKEAEKLRSNKIKRI
jgi:hypothetical protein